MVKALLPLASFLFAASLVAQADTLILNSGDTLEGSVVSETESEVVFSYQVSSGITDQQTYARSDIKELKKISKADLQYEQVKDIRLGGDSLSPAEYQRAIAALSAFVEAHPENANAAALRKVLADFKGEEERVSKGEIKWKGKWYTEEEAAEQRYQIAGYRYFQRMRDLAGRNDLLGALNTFSQIDANYSGAAIYPDAIGMAQQLIVQLSAQIDAAVAQFRIQDDRYKEGIDYVIEPEKSRMIRAREAKITKAENAIKAAAGLDWKPYYPIVPKSADELRKKCETETGRLAKLPVSQMRQSLRIAEAIPADIAEKKADEADAKLKEAGSLWKDNELLTRLSPIVKKLADEVKAEAKAAEVAKKEEAKEAAKESGKGKGKKGTKGKKAPKGADKKEAADPEKNADPEAKA